MLEEGCRRRYGGAAGVLFVSFIYERGLTGAGTTELIGASIGHLRERLLQLLERAAATRQMPPVDLPALADHVFTVIEGGFLLARALDDRDCMARQLGHLRAYLELLLSARSTA